MMGIVDATRLTAATMGTLGQITFCILMISVSHVAERGKDSGTKHGDRSDKDVNQGPNLASCLKIPKNTDFNIWGRF